ncbi:MAG: Fic family protein, partial [Mycoplasmataceae bacterium]|nr:Fic family protein [Mycoplasmataceae bacterium]
MKTFDYAKYLSINLDATTVSLLGQVYLFKGKLEEFIKNSPPILDKLSTIAKNQSTIASNAIEGILTTPKRIKDLLNLNAAPLSRSEEEI